MIEPAWLHQHFEPGGLLELFGRAETAEALGVSNSNLTTLRSLPEPVCRLKSGPVWLAAEIRAFAAERAKM